MEYDYSKLYKLITVKKDTYLSKYVFQLLLMFIISILLFLIIGYFNVKLLKKHKFNWSKNRCNPIYIPFAGLINKPANMTTSEYNVVNFEYCLNNILKDVTNIFTMPIRLLQNTIYLIIKSLSTTMNATRQYFSVIKNNLLNILKGIFSRIINFVLPIFQMLLGIKDMIHKIIGVITSLMYTLYAFILSMVSTFQLIKTFTIVLLINMVIALIVLIALSTLWPFGLALIPVVLIDTGIIVVISIILALMDAILKTSLNTTTTGSAPQVP